MSDIGLLIPENDLINENYGDKLKYDMAERSINEYKQAYNTEIEKIKKDSYSNGYHFAIQELKNSI